MIRFLLWLLVYIAFIGAASIRVKYKDGLNITFIGWVECFRKRTSAGDKP